MEKYFDLNVPDASIRCKLYYEKDPRHLTHVVVATYGFGGNKDNHAVQKFAERITTKYKGYGVICFDWPAHGADAQSHLSIPLCISYLNQVASCARNEWHPEKLFNYGSSLGAYVVLRDLHETGQNPFDRIALRCAAIRMYDSLARGISPAEWHQLEKGKSIVRGFDRKIRISQDFLEDLKTHDISQYDYLDFADDILMIHGTKDEMAPFPDASAFSDQNVIELIPVENADHPFSNPASMDYAIQKIIEFFAPVSV